MSPVKADQKVRIKYMWIIIIIVETELWEIHRKLAIIHKRQLICKLQTASPRNLQNLLTWTESKLLWTKIKRQKKNLKCWNNNKFIDAQSLAICILFHCLYMMPAPWPQGRNNWESHQCTVTCIPYDMCQNHVIPPNITTTDKHTLNTFPVYSSFSFRVLSMLL